MIRLGSDNKIGALKEVILYDNFQMKFEGLLKRSSRNNNLLTKNTGATLKLKSSYPPVL